MPNPDQHPPNISKPQFPSPIHGDNPKLSLKGWCRRTTMRRYLGSSGGTQHWRQAPAPSLSALHLAFDPQHLPRLEPRVAWGYWALMAHFSFMSVPPGGLSALQQHYQGGSQRLLPRGLRGQAGLLQRHQPLQQSRAVLGGAASYLPLRHRPPGHPVWQLQKVEAVAATMVALVRVSGKHNQMSQKGRQSKEVNHPTFGLQP